MPEKPNPRGVLYQQRPDLTPSWATRIPAAIKRAEELVGPDDWYANDSSTVVVTATEVALAAALLQLWEVWQGRLYGRIISESPHPVLVAFTEKVEALA